MAEVISHLHFQRLLNQQLRELLEQPVLTNQVFRLSVISQQAVQQLLGYGSLRYGHHRSWQWGSFLPIDRLHKNSYTLTSETDAAEFWRFQRGCEEGQTIERFLNRYRGRVELALVSAEDLGLEYLGNPQLGKNVLVVRPVSRV
jgi:hypothetical protein